MPRTAIVSFHNEEGEEVDSELFGAIDINQIYTIIKEGKDLVLDNSIFMHFPFLPISASTGLIKRNLFR